MAFDFDYKRNSNVISGLYFKKKIMAKITQSTILMTFFIIFNVLNIGMLIWILIVLREYNREIKFLETLYIEKFLIVNYKDYESLADFTVFRLLPYAAVLMTWMTIAAVFLSRSCSIFLSRSCDL